MRGDLSESTTRVVLIVDLVGSTAWRVDHGDLAADQMLMSFERSFEDVVADYDGRIVSNHGDGFLASFGSATKALEAAVRFRDILAALPVPQGVPQLRAGLAAGDVVERGREMYGLPVVEAARLESFAEPGQVLCSELVRALSGTRAMVSMKDRRSVELRGLPEPVVVWTVETNGADSDQLSSRVGLVRWREELPSIDDAFLGRATDVDDVASLVLANRIVTLLGTGGVGKTRLSIELANLLVDRFIDGIWFVQLEAAHSIDEVISAIARQLRLPSSVTDEGADGVGRVLGQLEALLILDNCEQASAAVANVVHAVAGGGANLRILCTSREVLGLRAEIVRPLQPLAFPEDLDDPDGTRKNDSVRLFVERARALDATRTFDDTALGHVARIVRRVEGLPLAIELAAARLNVLDPAALADRAEESFALLSRRNPDRPDRHHTISATVDWSVSLLSDVEERALIGISCFSGGATLDAIAAVCGEDSDLEVLDLVAGLVDKSLVRRGDDGRFSMLASVRETVLERPDTETKVGEARLRHLGYFEQLVLRSGSQVQHDPGVLAQFTAEHDNFNTALTAAIDLSKTRALKMSGHLALYWVLAGRAGEGDRRFAEVLAAPGEVDRGALANALRGAAMAAGLGARYVRSEDLLMEARSIYSELGRLESIAYCDYWLARNTVVQTHFGTLDARHLDRAFERLTSAIATFEAAGDRLGVLLAHPYLGWIRLLQGDHEEAERLTVRLLVLADGSGVGRIEAYARAHAAYVRLGVGDLDRVGDDIEACLGVLEESGDTQNLVITRCVATALYLQTGDERMTLFSARKLIEAALICDSAEWGVLVHGLGAHVLADRGDWSSAASVVRTLEHRHPNWRTPLAHMGIDPDVVLSHVTANSADRKVLPPGSVLKFIRSALEKATV